MKKERSCSGRLLVVLLGIIASGVAQASPVGRQQALLAARQFAAAHQRTVSTAQPRHSARRTAAADVAYYVFDIDDGYSDQSADRQKTAIAQLMLYVGVGCKMGYGPSSGAGFSEDVNAPVNYFVDDEGELQLIGSKQTVQLGANYYVGGEFRVEGLPAGAYRVVPVSKRGSQKGWQTDVNPAIRYVLAEVDGQGSVSLQLRPVEDIVLDGLTFPGSRKVGESQPVQAVFSNHADEFSREIHLLACQEGGSAEHICRTQVTIAEGGQTVSTFNFTPSQAGTWHVWLSTDYEGHDIIGDGTVDITAEGVAPAYNLRYVSHTVSNRSNGAVYGNRMQGRVTIMNQGDEPFDGMVRLWLFRLADNGYFYGANSMMVPLHIEPRKTAQAAYSFDRLDLNTTYNMSILYQQGGDIQDGGLRQMGRTQAGILYWQQNKTMSGVAPTSTFNVPSGAVAVDMTCAGGGVRNVRPNANPNTVYILPSGGQVPDGLDGCNVVVGDESESITLADDYGFWSPQAFTAQQAVYTRQAEAGWETIALPFAVDDLPGGVLLREFAEQQEGQTPTFGTASRLARNIPYIIYSGVGGSQQFAASCVRISSTDEAPMVAGTDDYHFVGTTISTTFYPGEVYAFNTGEACFSLIDERTTIKPFRAYFVGYVEEGSQPSRIVVDTSVPTAVAGVADPGRRDAPGCPVFYDLQGRRITQPGKGVYLFDGRKVVLK